MNKVGRNYEQTLNKVGRNYEQTLNKLIEIMNKPW